MLASSRWRFRSSKSLRPLGLVEILGRGFNQPVEPFQRGRQFADSFSLGGVSRRSWRAPARRAGLGQVFLQRLPRLGRLTSRASTAAREGPMDRKVPARSIPVKATRSRRIQALHRTQPSSRASTYLPGR